MEKQDLKTRTPDELVKMLGDLRKEQLNLRFQKSAGQLENASRIREVRRTIARVKTLLNAARTEGKKTSQRAKSASAPAKKKPAAKKKAA